MLAPIQPHGGTLIDLMVTPEQADDWKHRLISAPSLMLTPRQCCDLELLVTGAFSPLTGFMTKLEYQGVLESSRLPNNALWPVPIVLDIPNDLVDHIQSGDFIALRDHEEVLLAALEVDCVWPVNKEHEANAVYGTFDPEHPGVAYLMQHTKDHYVGGRIHGIHLPTHYDYLQYRHHPKELRDIFQNKLWQQVVALQTRNPLHKAHVFLAKQAMRLANANCVIHATTGETRSGDIDYYTRVKCYERVLQQFPRDATMISLIPLAMRMAGPKEALWHALIRQNYGFSHFVIGRDHAGPGSKNNGDKFYQPDAAVQYIQQFKDELLIKTVTTDEVVYSADRNEYVTLSLLKPNEKTLNLSGSELRRRLVHDIEIPEWFTFPEIVSELRRAIPPRAQRGFTLFFTGLPSSGKSTLANALRVRLRELQIRRTSLLDGDIVRKHLSEELGFSHADRIKNLMRIAFVAREITKHGGIAICAPIAPYANVRHQIRRFISETGDFIEIYVATPLEVCEQRDRKGLYKKARANIIKDFTGINDPYDVPTDAEITLNTQELSPPAAVQQIVLYLENKGYIPSSLEIESVGGFKYSTA